MLEGSVSDERQRRALAALAETVPGVKRVENRLVLIDMVGGVPTHEPDEGDGSLPV